MKQHTTAKQTDELSDKAKRRLSRWYLKRTGRGSIRETRGVAVLPYWLTIGQMIEFLGNGYKKVMFDLDDSEINTRMYDIVTDNLFDSDKLRDVLWEAVKEVLEK